jgi:hypothetical protein
MSLGNIKRRDAARVRHQMLHLSSTAHGKQTPLPRVLRLCAQAPQCIVEPVGFQDLGECQWLIICRGLS